MLRLIDFNSEQPNSNLKISKHLMLRLIYAKVLKRDLKVGNFKTSYVTVNR